MKKSKKIIALICAVALMLCVCGCSDEKKDALADGAEVSGVNEFPIVKEPITMSVFVAKNPYVEDYATNEFTKFYEEKTNIKLDWNVASGDTRQAFNLMLASGEYADIMLGLGLNKSERVSFAEQGIIIDIKPYIDEHGYYIKKAFEEKPDAEKSMTIDGKIFGLASISEGYTAVYPDKMWVYKPWLENLGLKMPETTEDFYNMLKAFKTQDPNGNGKADEIPLAARGVAENWGIKNFIMSAFIPEGGTGWYAEDGKVKITAVQPEFKEGIKYIKKLYDEGLLDPDTFIYDRSQIMALGENEPVVLGCAPGTSPSMFTIQGDAAKRYYDYAAVTPLEGPKGVRSTVKKAESYFAAFVVSSACKNPAAAVKWIDWLYSMEGTDMSQGTPGAFVRDAKEGEKGPDGTQAKWAKDPVTVADDATGMTQNKTWKNLNIRFGSMEQSLKTCDYNNTVDKHGEFYKSYVNYQPYEVTNFIADLPIPAEHAAEYSEIHLNLYNEMNTYFTDFVTGAADVDKDWDTYIKTLNGLGFENYLKYLQMGYDAQ